MSLIIETKILKELSKIASKNENYNANIKMIRLDKDPVSGKARLWATDGICMVSYGLGVEAPEIGSCYALDHIKKLTKNDVVALENGFLKDDRGQLPLSEDQTAPDIDAVIPGLIPTENTCESPKIFGVNPALVFRVMGVLSKISGDQLCKIQLGLGAMDAIRLDCGPCTAVIMPMEA